MLINHYCNVKINVWIRISDKIIIIVILILLLLLIIIIKKKKRKKRKKVLFTFNITYSLQTDKTKHR